MSIQYEKIWRRGVTALFLFTWLSATMPVYAAEPTTRTDTPITESELVGLIIKAYGGKDTLTKVRSIHTQGIVKVYQRDNDGRINHYLQHPRKLRVEASYNNTPETRILNGKKGWKGVGTAAQKEADRKEYEGLLFQYNYMDIPFSLLEGSMGVVYKGKDTTGKSPLDVLVLKDMNGQEVTLSVDEKTHLITKASSHITAGSTKDEVSVEFLDYRDVDSIKMPFKIINIFRIHRISETLMSRIVINPLMDDKFFQP